MNIGQSFEDIVAKDCGGTKSPGSGRFPGKKSDVVDQSGKLYIECKSRSRQSKRGLKVEVCWLVQLLNNFFRDMGQDKIPALAVTTSQSQEDYIVLVHSSRLIATSTKGIKVKMYGWPTHNVVRARILEGEHSFTIKPPEHKDFFNAIVVPSIASSTSFWLYDRDLFKQLTRTLL